jgi:hypothetical protein
VEALLWGTLAAANAALLEAARQNANHAASSPQRASTTTTSSSSSTGPSKPSWFPQGAGYRELTLTRSQAQAIASQAAAALLQLAAADVPQQHLPVLASAAAWVEQQPLSLCSSDVLSAVDDIAAELVRGKAGSARSKAGKSGSPASSSKRSQKAFKRGSSSSSSSSDNKVAAGAAPGGTNGRKQHPLIVFADLGDEHDARDQMQVLAAAGYLAWPRGAPASGGRPDSSTTTCGNSSSSGADASGCGTSSTTVTTDPISSSAFSGPTAAPASNTSTVTPTCTTMMVRGGGDGSSSSPVDSPLTKRNGASRLEAVSSTGNRLHPLAAAVVTQWRGMPWTDWRGKATTDSHIKRFLQENEQWAKQFYVVAQLLMLLVQQLQGVSPQQRGAFLCSPTGTTLLWVLSEMSSYAKTKTDMSVMEVLMAPRPQQAGTGQQVQAAAAGWVNHWAQGRAMVELLLLPGLLLEPAPEPVPSGGDGVEGISSSTSDGCSTASKQLQGASKPSDAGSSCSSSGGSSTSNTQGAGLSGATGTEASARSSSFVVALQGE